MSSSDSDSSSNSSSSDSEAEEIYTAIRAYIETIHQQITELSREAETLEDDLRSLHPPLQDLTLSQLGDIPFLEKSPFRVATFAVKSPGFAGIDLTKRYMFKDICQMLRTYLFSSGAITPDGQVMLTSQLQTLFELEDVSKIGYIELLGKLRSVLV